MTLSSVLPSRQRSIVLSGFAALVGLAVSLGASPAQNDHSEHFTAQAVNPNSMGAASGARVDMSIDRWSTDAERDTLVTSLKENGPEKLLKTLQGMPRVGSIGRTGAAGFDVHYARRVQTASQGERITLVTDRPIGFWEAFNQPRLTDYPFTLVELRIGADGKGEGKLSTATKVSLDKDNNNALALENYEQQPVLLMGVERVK